MELSPENDDFIFFITFNCDKLNLVGDSYE